MVYQFYVMEIQQYADGFYGDIKHFAWDEGFPLMHQCYKHEVTPEPEPVEE